MKTARPPAAEAGPSSSRRAQPVRQTRTNPPRITSGPSRTFGGRESHGAGPAPEQPIDIFPAITHFTDAITSLPKDLVRHFTLLKEVDAKIFVPEEVLFQLVDGVLKSNPPEPRHPNDASSSIAPASTTMSAQNSSTGNPTAGSVEANYNPAVYDPGNLPRRQLIRDTALKIQEMLVALEEKSHVISTANEALSKQLERIDDVWPHLESEFSDEAKWGSTTHWAYPENRISRANQAERSRRDGAAQIAAAAQQVAAAEEAAARSDARKQAMKEKKNLKAQHQDSDMDDQDHSKQQKNEPTKKAHGGGKARKGAEPPAPVGLGISAGAAANANPPTKRRKVDSGKTVNGGQPMERAMSSVFGNNKDNNTSKPKSSSPRATPAPEQPKKRKALPTTNGLSKKNKTAAAAAASPSTTSTPIQPNFAESKTGSRNSPAPSRPVSSRARQNSIQSNTENGRQRPASAASSKPNGVMAALVDAATLPNGPRPSTEPKAPKEPPPTIKTEASKDESRRASVSTSNTNGGSKKETGTKADEPETQVEAITTTTVITTKSGRASKPSTPAIGSFPDSAPRSRSARNTNTTTTKRSHKKGAAQQALATRMADEDANSSVQGDDEGEIDADEPLYCYCNSVSYGEMVACDADDCPREWFHLDCAGLKAAPPTHTKWYCNNCKDRLRGGKKVNGR